MARTIEGTLEAGDHRFAIVAARFNELFVDRLVQGAVDGLKRHGVKDGAIDVVRVPGSLEIPVTAQRLAANQSYGAIICLGVVIRGATVHFEHVADGTASGIAHVALAADIPVINGLIAAETLEQAMERSGAKLGNKGFDAAMAALEMANLLQQL
ncbi:MAG: 6,7-dimethyl-8-ribityllumazine synthase [Chloroflexi bacterium]|nr:6,7-dimethyl-8-ribityllumazine synthase [Chloroflexota bacterium]